LDEIGFGERIMEDQNRKPIQVNLLSGMLEIVNRIEDESSAPKARIVEYFVRLGMNAAGYGPKGQGTMKQELRHKPTV